MNELNAGSGGLDIVKAIIEMAHSLRLQVIAEGVETEEQMYLLRQLGCNYVQGFLFSKPITAGAAAPLYGETREYGLVPSVPAMLTCDRPATVAFITG